MYKGTEVIHMTTISTLDGTTAASHAPMGPPPARPAGPPPSEESTEANGVPSLTDSVSISDTSSLLSYLTSSDDDEEDDDDTVSTLLDQLQASINYSSETSESLASIISTASQSKLLASVEAAKQDLKKQSEQAAEVEEKTISKAMNLEKVLEDKAIANASLTTEEDEDSTTDYLNQLLQKANRSTNPNSTTPQSLLNQLTASGDLSKMSLGL